MKYQQEYIGLKNHSYIVLVAAVIAIAFFSALLIPITGKAEQIIPIQQKNDSLHTRLPGDVKNSGLISAIDSAYPPYVLLSADKMEGAAIDLAKATSEILGINVEHKIVDGFAGLMLGIQSGKYHITFSPIVDTLQREEKNDFVSIARGLTSLGVLKGNPDNINTLADLCGKKIAVQAGSLAETTAKKQSQSCTKYNKNIINIQSYKDNPATILALKARRVQAVITATFFFAAQKDDQIEQAAIMQDLDNSISVTYQAVVLSKNSPLTPIMLAAFQQLFDNGTYATIMKKWGLERNMIPAPGINLAGKEQKK